MKNRIATIVGLSLSAATLTASLVAASPAVAAAPPSSPVAHTNIVGGTKSAPTNWLVQLEFGYSTTRGSAVYGCTGEQINASWILTARHCVDGIVYMNVYHSNSTINRGTAIAADRVYAAPRGDIALVHMSKSSALSSYPGLNLTGSVASTGTGIIAGYGLRANTQRSDGLYQANVNLVGSSTDAFGGIAQHLTGITGAANHGDSGGPLVVNGLVVAVCSTGDSDDPGANIHAGASYAILSQSATWIRQTAGL